MNPEIVSRFILYDATPFPFLAQSLRKKMARGKTGSESPVPGSLNTKEGRLCIIM
jgi:hypothetical protein